MLCAGRTDDDGVAILLLQLTVVRQPAERDLSEREAVLLGDFFDLAKGLEVGLVPVAMCALCKDTASF